MSNTNTRPLETEPEGTQKLRKTLDGEGAPVGVPSVDPRVPGFQWQPAQLKAIAALEGKPSFVLMLAVGLGKTLVAIREMLLTPGWSAVFSSKTVQATWVRQMAEFYPDVPFVAVRSGKKERAADLAEAIKLIGEGVDVIVSITYPQLSGGIADELRGVAAPGMIVVDENSLRYLGTNKAKALLSLRAPTARFLMLTATPYQNSAADLMSLCVLMGAKEIGYTDKPLTLDSTQGQITTLAKNMERWLANQIFSYLRDKILIVRAQDNPWDVVRQCIAATGEEELDMPAIRKEAKKVLKEIASLSMSLSGIGGGYRRVWWKARKRELIEYKKEMNARLLDKELHRFTEPLQACLGKFLEEHHNPDRPLLVFANYLFTRKAVVEDLQKRGFAVTQFTAKLKPKERLGMIRRFQAGEPEPGQVLDGRPRAMVVGIKVLREGVTLTAAHQTVFIPETFNPMDYVQSEGRTNRQGQTAEKVGIFYLVSRRGDTGRVFKMIRLKLGLAEKAMLALEKGNASVFSAALVLAADENIRKVAKGGVEGLVAAENLSDEGRALLARYVPASVMDEGERELETYPLL